MATKGPDNSYTRYQSSGSSIQTPEAAQSSPTVLCHHKQANEFQVLLAVLFLAGLGLSISTVDEQYSTGLIYGGSISIVCCVSVMFSYATRLKTHEHPNRLIFYRTIADLIFAVQILVEQLVRWQWFDSKFLCNANTFQCGCSADPSASAFCRVFSAVIEFSLIASICWYFCMAINLYLSLTNPFTNFKANTRVFHCLSWGSGLLMGLIVYFLPDIAGLSELEFCWQNALQGSQPASPVSCSEPTTVQDIFNVPRDTAAQTYTRYLYYQGWLIIFLAGSVAVLVWAWRRLSEGIPETYIVRKQAILRAQLYVSVVTGYWIIVLVLYATYVKLKPDHERNHLLEATNYIFASRGYIDAVVWFAFHDFYLPWVNKDQVISSEELDCVLQPQVNVALRRQILFYTTSGIAEAIQAAADTPASSSPRERRITLRMRADSVSSGNRDARTAKYFYDFEPHVFQRVREQCRLDPSSYIESLSKSAKERLNEGRSGAFMFYSSCGRFIVKSMSEDEAKFLRSIAVQYAEYLETHPRSFLTRFYGCHCLEIYRTKFFFVVMRNIFCTEQTLTKLYDIKGSWVNRTASLPKRGDHVDCKHCNSVFLYDLPNESVSCLHAKRHEAKIVYKDNDLTSRLTLDHATSLRVYKQLVTDSNFLASLGIMDFSLLLGVHSEEPENPDHISFIESAFIDSQGATGAPFEYYDLGIIDILQRWTLEKQVERLVKIGRCKDKARISAVRPSVYTERFQSKMAQLFNLTEFLQSKPNPIRDTAITSSSDGSEEIHACKRLYRVQSMPDGPLV